MSQSLRTSRNTRAVPDVSYISIQCHIFSLKKPGIDEAFRLRANSIIEMLLDFV